MVRGFGTRFGTHVFRGAFPLPSLSHSAVKNAASVSLILHISPRTHTHTHTQTNTNTLPLRSESFSVPLPSELIHSLPHTRGKRNKIFLILTPNVMQSNACVRKCEFIHVVTGFTRRIRSPSDINQQRCGNTGCKRCECELKYSGNTYITLAACNTSEDAAC